LIFRVKYRFKLYNIFNRYKYFSECKSSTKKFFQWGQRWVLYTFVSYNNSVRIKVQWW